MKKLLAVAVVAAAGLVTAAAPASAGERPYCVSLDTTCWNYDCEKGEFQRIEWLDTGPVIIICNV